MNCIRSEANERSYRLDLAEFEGQLMPVCRKGSSFVLQDEKVPLCEQQAL